MIAGAWESSPSGQYIVRTCDDHDRTRSGNVIRCNVFLHSKHTHLPARFPTNPAATIDLAHLHFSFGCARPPAQSINSFYARCISDHARAAHTHTLKSKSHALCCALCLAGFEAPAGARQRRLTRARAHFGADNWRCADRRHACGTCVRACV